MDQGLLMFGAALAVLVAVYILSLRSPGSPRDDPSPGADPESPFYYVPVLPAPEPEWRVRVGAVLVLVLLTIAAAGVAALGMYQLGHAVNQLLRGFLGE
jgi:hypothetical protein